MYINEAHIEINLVGLDSGVQEIMTHKWHPPLSFSSNLKKTQIESANFLNTWPLIGQTLPTKIAACICFLKMALVFAQIHLQIFRLWTDIFSWCRKLTQPTCKEQNRVCQNPWNSERRSPSLPPRCCSRPPWMSRGPTLAWRCRWCCKIYNNLCDH